MRHEPPHEDRMPMIAGASRAGTRHRRGAVLVIVIGLASVLLVLAVAFMARMRADSQEVRVVLEECQARLMMHASLMYIQECSRIGWGDACGETYGWTDVRDGSLGPRGARPAGAMADGASIPAPPWWRSGWPAYAWDGDDASLPPVSSRRGGWPVPGSATRCPMAMCQTPPYATQLTMAYNPVNPPVRYGDSAWTTPWDRETRSITSIWSAMQVVYSNYDNAVTWPNGWIDTIFNTSPGAAGASGAKGMLDPQPVAETWPAFRNGAVAPGATSGDWVHEAFDAAGRPSGGSQQLAIVPGTENQSWFRVYRETQKDHDCIDNVGKPGTEWWDRVGLYDATAPRDPGTQKIRNWSVFIVACGAGSTRGYRFWDDAEISRWESAHGLVPGTGRALEPVTAQESGLFTGESVFRDLYANSCIIWYRCEWSGMQSGGRTAAIYNDPIWRQATSAFEHQGVLGFGGANDHERIWDAWTSGPPPYEFTAQYATTQATFGSSDTRSLSPKVYAGNIAWLQRMDRDPILW